MLVHVRTRVLTGQLAAAHSLDYLSGLLVGEELRCALPQQNEQTSGHARPPCAAHQ